MKNEPTDQFNQIWEEYYSEDGKKLRRLKKNKEQRIEQTKKDAGM